MKKLLMVKQHNAVWCT